MDASRSNSRSNETPLGGSGIENTRDVIAAELEGVKLQADKAYALSLIEQAKEAQESGPTIFGEDVTVPGKGGEVVIDAEQRVKIASPAFRYGPNKTYHIRILDYDDDQKVLGIIEAQRLGQMLGFQPEPIQPRVELIPPALDTPPATTPDPRADRLNWEHDTAFSTAEVQATLGDKEGNERKPYNLKVADTILPNKRHWLYTGGSLGQRVAGSLDLSSRAAQEKLKSLAVTQLKNMYKDGFRHFIVFDYSRKEHLDVAAAQAQAELVAEAQRAGQTIENPPFTFHCINYYAQGSLQQSKEQFRRNYESILRNGGKMYSGCRYGSHRSVAFAGLGLCAVGACTDWGDARAALRGMTDADFPTSGNKETRAMAQRLAEASLIEPETQRLRQLTAGYTQAPSLQPTPETLSVRFNPIEYIKLQHKESCVSSYEPGIVQLSSRVDDLKLREIMEPGQRFFLFDGDRKTEVTWGQSREGRMDYIDNHNKRVLITGGCALVSPELADTYLERKWHRILDAAALQVESAEWDRNSERADREFPYRFIKHDQGGRLSSGGEPGFYTTDPNESRRERYSEEYAVSQIRYLYHEEGINHIITTNGHERVRDAVAVVNQELKAEGLPLIGHDYITVYDDEGRDRLGQRVLQLWQNPNVKMYIHCTAGKHRAPAAATIAMMHLGADSFEEAKRLVDLEERHYEGDQRSFFKRVESYAEKFYNRLERAKTTYPRQVASQDSEIKVRYEVAATMPDPLIESSGIASSYHTPNAIWTHNDSGGSPTLYLVSTESGAVLNSLEIQQSLNRDWEDITTFQMGGVPCIAVGDFGDNARKRGECQICIIREPQPSSQNTKYAPEYWTDIRFQYEDGRPRDAESLAYDPSGNRFLLIEKDTDGATEIFELPIPSGDTSGAIARKIGSINVGNFSAMDISRDGTRLLARAYNTGYLFTREAGETWEEVFAKPLPQPLQLPKQHKGEGVCFESDGTSVLLSTEGKNQPLYRTRLDAAPDMTQSFVETGRVLYRHFNSRYVSFDDKTGAVTLKNIKGWININSIINKNSLRGSSTEFWLHGRGRCYWTGRGFMNDGNIMTSIHNGAVLWQSPEHYTAVKKRPLNIYDGGENHSVETRDQGLKYG